MYCIASTLIKAGKMADSLGMHYAEMLCMMAVYESWVSYGLGLNCNEVVRVLCLHRGNYNNVRGRLRNLKLGGFVEVVGTGRNESMLYAPTDYCIAVVEEHFGSTEGEDKDALM